MSDVDYWQHLVSFPDHDPGALFAALAGNRLELDRPDWHRRAACRGVGPDIFFVESGGRYTEADAYCRRCPVTDECLGFAVKNVERGRWGGTSDRQRRRIRDRYDAA